MNIIPIALASGATYWIYNHYFKGAASGGGSGSGPFAFQPVTGGVTKKPWKTRVTNVTGSGDDKRSVVEIWAPAGSWGPHLDLLVVTYEQKGSDKDSRKVLQYGPDALAAMVTAAGQDFGIAKPTATISGRQRFKPDVWTPLYHYQDKSRRIGDVMAYHDGQQWLTVARDSRNVPYPKPSSLGRSKTLRTAVNTARAYASRAYDRNQHQLSLVRSSRGQ